MKKLSLAALVAACALVAVPATASASGVDYPDADWSQASITEPDGTVLHADILRPKGFGLDASHKTPVIVSIGPYFNHSGQVGPAGDTPLESGVSYDPIGPNAGPSERFADFVEGSHLLDPNRPGGAYTFVMVDLRGYGGSTGCPDWGGPGEQSDVASAITWASKQAWSTGAVGTYGKSYDAMTGLIATALHPDGLKAVVAQEPVYDDYRYLYGDGIRRENFAATPALYDTISLTPGPASDDPTYNAASEQENVASPGCHATNWASQAGNDDHYSPYWRQRNLINEVKGSNVPLFITQGLTENNTAPDGTAEFLQNHTGPERGWLGPWNHVRGNELDGTKLAMGRKGWYDEVMRWYDQYLQGITPAVQDPPFAIQSVTTGRWRPELQWPPADATPYTTDLASGTYTDDAQESGTGDSGAGVWTVSTPLPYDVHMAGSATITVDASAQLPDANVVADIYDLDATGKGPLVARQGALLRNNGTVTLHMMSSDWRFKQGHRIGVRITSNNSEWWIAALPTNQTVTVYGGTATFPFLQYDRTQRIQGDSGTTRGAWIAKTETAPTDKARDFNLPPALAPEPADMAAALNQFQ
jgi:predicted acyl esterase